MKQKIKERIEYYRNSITTIVSFEMVYKMVGVAVGYPLLVLMLQGAIRLAGIKYLTNGYFYRFLSRPSTIIMMIAAVLVVGMYCLYEVLFIASYHEGMHRKWQLNVYEAAAAAFQSFKRVFSLQNILIVPYIVMMVAVINIVVVYNTIIAAFTFPDSIKKTLMKNDMAIVAVVVIYAILLLISVFLVMTPAIFATENKNFFKAAKESAGIVKKRFFSVLFQIIGWNIMIAAIWLVVYVVISLLLIVGVRLLRMTHMGTAIYLTFMRTINGVINLFMNLLSVPVIYGLISRMYYKYRPSQERVEAVNRIPAINQSRNKKRDSVLKGVTTAAIVINVVYAVMAFMDNPFDNVDMLKTTLITSHRGSSMNYPENTMAAFEGAVDEFCDYIELDIRQTKDGVIVVMHDASLKRTTGVTEYVYNMVYSDIQELSAGAWFSKAYEEEKIPTFEEVLQFAEGKVKLNIEVKTSKYDTNFAEKIYALLEEYDFIDDCVVSSFDYTILKELKALDEDIQTGYILSVVYGDFYDMEGIDFFSVNYSFVTKRMVDAIHQAGKEIHVWTVNKAGLINNYANMGVDNIITDNALLAREIIYSKNTSNKVIEMLKYVFDR